MRNIYINVCLRINYANEIACIFDFWFQKINITFFFKIPIKKII